MKPVAFENPRKTQMPPTVLIYCDILLESCRMFIVRMAESYSRFTPHYVGLRRVRGIDLPADRTIVVNPSSSTCNTQEALFRYFQIVPEKLRRHFGEARPVLVHSQFGWDGARGMILAEKLRVPHIVHFRGCDATYLDSEMRKMSRFTLHYLREREKLKTRAALFVAISDFIRRKLEAQGFPLEKLVAHHTGIDLEFFQPDGTIPRQPVVLFVGRLTKYKGCEYLIRAMSEVQKVFPELELAIIGDGDERASLEKLASSSLRRYQFLGWLNQESVRGWMCRARMLAFPSVTLQSGEAEGLGNVALEAQALGLPVVGHFHGGIPEAVRSDETGILVPERDTPALASAVLEVARNGDLWQRFSSAGQRHVRAHFDVRKRNRLLEGYYDSVLKEQKAGCVGRAHAEPGPLWAHIPARKLPGLRNRFSCKAMS